MSGDKPEIYESQDNDDDRENPRYFLYIYYDGVTDDIIYEGDSRECEEGIEIENNDIEYLRVESADNEKIGEKV
jgi:hypothetical protein